MLISEEELLCLAVRTEYVHDLVDVLLLHILTSWTEVLTWIELSWVLSKNLTNSCSHCETRVRVDVDLAYSRLSSLAKPWFVRPSQTDILLFCVSFPWGWS